MVNMNLGDLMRVLCEKGVLTIPDHRNPQNLEVSARTAHAGHYGSERRLYTFPYAEAGFQFEAAHVCDCLKNGLTESPRVTRKESLSLMRIADEIRRQAGFKYPFE